jgi:rhamnosyl/mannosyltransferase
VTTQRPPILLIASEMAPTRSGIAEVAGGLATRLRDRGYPVRTLSSADAWRRHIGEFRVSALWTRFGRLGRLVGDAELVVLLGPAPFISDALLARWRVSAPCPLVYAHHFTVELDRLPRISEVYNRLYLPLMRSAAAVVVSSASYAQLLAERGIRTVTLIPLAVDPPADRVSRRHGDRSGVLRVLFVGQQRPYKGVDGLVRAAANLPGVEVTIAGGGHDANRIVDLIATLSASNITHLGPISDPTRAELFATHQVIALPSTNRSEAFGLVLLEGMHYGCVPVASALPGVTDLVADTGILVPPRDVIALRTALTALAASPERVAELSGAAAKRAVSYDWDRALDQYEALFHTVLEGRRTTTSTSSRPR